MIEVEFRVSFTIRAVVPTGTSQEAVVGTVQGILEDGDSRSAEMQDVFVAALGDEFAYDIEDAVFGTVKVEVEAV
jgi:hypothetical protein